MIEAINIRIASERDAEEINTFGRATFISTYTKHNTHVDMQLYLNNQFTINKLREELSDPAHCYITANLENRIVGYTHLLKQYLESRQDNVIRMNRIYVDTSYQKRRIGSMLMKAAIQYVQNQEFKCLVLGVWEKNTQALAFYKKWGFQIFGDEIFLLGKDEQRDILLEN